MKLKTRLGILFGVCLLVNACSTYTLTDNEKGELIDYSSAAPDTGLTKLMKPYSDTCRAAMNVVVGYVAEDLEKGYPEGKLGDVMADIFYDMALERNPAFSSTTTFSLFNNGGLRVPLQKGAVTRGKVFELMPFENMLVAVKLKGVYLVKDMAAYLLAKKGQPLSRNVQVVFRNGQLVKMEIGGMPVDTTREYTVLTSDYLSGGGDNMEFFKKGVPVEAGFTVKLRDGILDFLSMKTSVQNPLQAPSGGRIKIE